MKTQTEKVLLAFRNNIKSVADLLSFDQAILELATINLREIALILRSAGKTQHANGIENRVEGLEKIHESESLSKYYKAMYNQCVVLLVSYFASSVHDLFRSAVSYALKEKLTVPVTKEEVKLTWADFGGGGEESARVFADLLVSQKDISFQDMQSITRAFKTFFEINIDRDSNVNEIILGQAARHVIAHSGGIVDQKMLKQLQTSAPRSLKQELVIGEKLDFSPEEVRVLMAAMGAYMSELSNKLVDTLARNRARQAE